MRLTEKNQIKKLLILLVIILTQYSFLSGQISISGPNCIIPGSPYQYSLIGNWTSASTMRVCVSGGRLMDSTFCTSDTGRVTSILVVWSDSSSRKIELTSSLGSASFPVEATSNLAGGSIKEEYRVKLYDTAISRYIFYCDPATGGTCQPVYLYQWQRSDNGLNWVNIPGATTSNLDFTGSVLVNTYFRRVTSETTSRTMAYSDNALLVVGFNQ